MGKIPGLTLASNSPRRRQLLSLTGLDFQVQAASLDESLLPGEHPRDYVIRLARAKAEEVSRIVGGSGFFLAADTIVVDNDAILGKPSDQQEAFSMLKGLRGHTHQVYSGMVLRRAHKNQAVSDLCVIDVPMRDYSDQEINAYVATEDPLDKAGAYAIQHDGFHPVENMQGCYAGVMGLPLCHLVRMFRRMDVTLNENVPSQCQAELNYDCPVWQKILDDSELFEGLSQQKGLKKKE